MAGNFNLPRVSRMWGNKMAIVYLLVNLISFLVMGVLALEYMDHAGTAFYVVSAIFGAGVASQIVLALFAFRVPHPISRAGDWVVGIYLPRGEVAITEEAEPFVGRLVVWRAVDQPHGDWEMRPVEPGGRGNSAVRVPLRHLLIWEPRRPFLF